MNGFSELDMVNYRYLVYSNIIQSVWQLIEGAKTMNVDVDPDAEVKISMWEEISLSHA